MSQLAPQSETGGTAQVLCFLWMVTSVPPWRAGLGRTPGKIDNFWQASWRMLTGQPGAPCLKAEAKKGSSGLVRRSRSSLNRALVIHRSVALAGNVAGRRHAEHGR